MLQDSLALQIPADSSLSNIDSLSVNFVINEANWIASVPADTSISFYSLPEVSDSINYYSNPAYTNIYSGHELKPVHLTPQLKENIIPGWFFPVIIIVLLVFVWLRIYYNKYFTQMLQAFVNNNLTNQIVRDENILVQRASVYLSVAFNLIIALFIYEISIHYNWQVAGINPGFSRYIFFAIIISAIYSIKFLLLKISGWLFDLDREMATYIFNTFLINNLLGIILFPLICLIAYNQSISIAPLIIIGSILIFLAFTYRIVRGIAIGMNTLSFSPLYLFLYLCTLEICPLLILIRLIIP